MPLFKRDNSQRDDGQNPPRTPLIALKDMPKATSPVPYLGTEAFDLIPGFLFLNWGTAAGVLTVAYATTDDNGWSRAEWVRDLKPETKCLIQVVREGFHTPDGPDVLDLSIEDVHDRDQMWRYYTRAIGQPAPYWPKDVAFENLIAVWRPGHPPVTTMPVLSLDMSPLLEMSALYPPDSSTHRVLMYYYLRVLHDAGTLSRWVAEAATDPHYEAFNEDHPQAFTDRLVLAAAAIDAQRPKELDDLGDTAIRAVFAEISDRHDTLAVRVIECIHMFGAQHHLPFAEIDRYRVGEVAMLDEWLKQLDEVPMHVPDPRFGHFAPKYYPRVQRRLVDRATGAPVVELVDFHGAVEEYVTALPRRLPAITPLAELIIDNGGHSLWVRTADGTLYPAPGGRYGVAWGYSGSIIGPLIERLLDNVNAEPIDSPERPKHNGLTKLTKSDVPNGTVFTRAELEAARGHS